MFPTRVLVVCCLLAFVCAASRAADEKPKEQAPAPRLVSKKYTIHFKDAKWDDVLDWYAKETGLVLITPVKPTGTVSITPSKDRTFTVGEVTDFLNEAMMQQKFILIRRHMTFFIQPADEKMEPRDRIARYRRVTLGELAECGRTELVQVLLPVQGIAAEDALDELTRLLTPFGTMTAVKDNALLISDTVRNIVRIQKTLET